MSTNLNTNSWNKQAKRYHKESKYPLDDIVYYDNCFPTEKDLKLFPDDIEGMKILELGSGHCNCGIAVTKRGADVTCLDISEEQIKIGEKLAKQENVDIKIILGDYHELGKFENDSYNLVMSIVALPYAKDIKHIFGEVFRILKHGGTFIFSTDHPAFAAAFKNQSYNFRGEDRWKWDDKDDFEFVTYERPVCDYINYLVESGFTIKRMEELFPKKKTGDWNEREDKLREQFPTCLVIKVKK